ncbi:MAG: PQQ-dependent sugar dehydrogenase [Ferruginibacter sp.]
MIPFSPSLHRRTIFYFISLVLITIILLGFTFNAKAQPFPTGFSQVLVASGISNPTVMAQAPDGRIFVAQQTGELRIIKNGSLLPNPFISLSVNSAGERGLLGIAFDPNFNTNHYIYLYYTLPSASNNRISRFTANGDAVVPGSEFIVLNLDPLSSATNHNGGTLAFGPDGKLYVGVGENANGANSQNPNTYLGKILRINPNGTIPTGNPYTSGSAQRRRTWASGMRNPYTITFQPGTGRLFVNDVGQNTWEEINDATTGGLNFGWPNAEGNSSNPAYTNPVYYYGHGSGADLGCAITGGAFFNPVATTYPASYIGKYFFIDFCGNWMNALTLSGSTGTSAHFGSGIAGSPVSVITGLDGNLYFLSRSNGALYKVTYTTSGVNTVLNPVADAFVRSGSASATNYGSDKKLYTKNSSVSSGIYQTYLRFDISSLATNAASVKLRLYGYLNNTSIASVTAQVFNVANTTWQEAVINYDNKPAPDATVLASTNVAGTTQQYYEWDLTQHINNLRSTGATSVSLLVKNLTLATTTLIVFNSKETATNKPELSATYAGRQSENNIPITQLTGKQTGTEFSFSAYPNPATNAVTLQYPQEFKNKKLQVTDIAGRIVKNILLTNTSMQTIMTNDLKTGSYILTVDNNGRKYSQKLLIKN